MAHQFSWPRTQYLYAIGNTPAVCLTRDVAPEENIDLLLLGCGDPRNVLFTIFCEPSQSVRKLDFTCCDKEPAVLARNVMLLSMIYDADEYTGDIWNSFFHMYLSNASHAYLVGHCQKLVGYSENILRWNQSPYGSFLRMSTEYTLSELRRHWTLYADMHELPVDRLATLRSAFTKQAQSSSTMYYRILSSARSAGPLAIQAIEATSAQFKQYWKTGTTFSNPTDAAAATILNPTFSYSLAGEGCAVHYATDPLMPFHLAPVFGNRHGSVSVSDIVEAAKAEFNDWCKVFHHSVAPSTTSSRPVVRFILAEATAACRSLKAFAATETLKSGVPVDQFKTQVLELSRDEYATVSGAPAIFNVIETSNLVDHLGLLNVFIASIPLLSRSAPSRVLYTESLLYSGVDATKDFTKQLYGDITAIGIVLDLCPVDYLCGFAARSDTHELAMHMAVKGDTSRKQFHQVTTWKSPSSGDPYACQSDLTQRKLSFEPHQLATFLYDMYYLLFEQEDAKNFFRLNHDNLRNAISSSTLSHYIRESFALFLKLVRDELGASDRDWANIMDNFCGFLDADQSLPMDLNNYNDFCMQLYRHGVWFPDAYHQFIPKIGRFAHWNVVPPVIRIILTVPRQQLRVLEHAPEAYGTPLVQCDVRGKWCHNIFSSVHVAYGQVSTMGTMANPWASFQEDLLGHSGHSALIVTFTMPSRLLTTYEPQDDLWVCLSLKSGPASISFMRELDAHLTIYRASLMDKSHVIILPEQPLPSERLRVSTRPPGTSNPIGQVGAVSVELDGQCELVTSLTCKISVETCDAKTLFQAKAVPEISQISPCTMRVSLAHHSQDIRYPFPIVGSQHKARLARTSLYIEVIVPVSGPFKADGMKMNPFPVVRRGHVTVPWSIHRVNPARMPLLDIKAKALRHWLNPHIGSMLSTREHSLRKNHKNDALMNLKDALIKILLCASGIQKGPLRRLFAFYDDATDICDTLLFIGDVRYELHSHTVLCDGYVLPRPQHDLMQKIQRDFTKLLTSHGGPLRIRFSRETMRAWKQLIPAFVERCRSWHHKDDCEYVSQGRIPLTEETDLDPLCSCGRGKDTEGMDTEALWKKFAPYVTRLALSPLFAVSYLESIGRDPAAHKCSVCRGKGKPKLMACKACKKVQYCSAACQKKDWKAHKPKCTP
ncbi:hypothetical protein DENSPDRAFT_858545 [Dentipellis sp. KUC8613]|nr:hypothetical protein DENSPDRAFT_858545 [Dentipellis sp. KUC8613]